METTTKAGTTTGAATTTQATFITPTTFTTPATPTGTPPRRPSDIHNPNNQHSDVSTSSAAGIIIGLFIVLAILAGAGYILYSRLRARRLGMPPPSLNPFADSHAVSGSGGGRTGGGMGWVKDQFASVRRGREAGGAYEGTSAGGGRGGRRGVGLDPDDTWNDRVGGEAEYGYEEQELGVRGGRGLQGESAYGRSDYGRSEYGQFGARDGADEGFETGRGRPSNPFEDPDGASSLRDVSPRPEEHERLGVGRVSGDSPTERKSVFKEVV